MRTPSPSSTPPVVVAVTPVPADATSPVAIYVLLGLLAFAGNYLLSSGFGVYEDDYLFTLPAFDWTGADCWHRVWHSLTSWPQGRPIGFAWNDLLAWLSARGSTLQLGYLLGFALMFVNTVLCFRLARTWLPVFGAFVCAAVFCLYPTDTSKVILMHRAFLLTGGCWMLSAFLNYRRGRFVRAYIFAALTLLTYETYFLPFLAAPLVVTSLAELRWKRIIGHGAVCGGILGAVILLRRAFGDSRAMDAVNSLPDIASKIGKALYIGPATSLRGLWARPWDALLHGDALQWWIVIGAATAICFLLRPLFPVVSVADEPSPANPDSPPLTLSSLGLLAIGCALVLAASFGLTFRPDNYPPIVGIGRLSAFNSPGSLGPALFLGALATFLVSLFRRPRWVVAGFGIYLGALVSFGLEVQKVDYVESWSRQRAFWNEILATSGEWTAGTPILVNIDGGAERPATPGFPPFWMVNYAPFLADKLVTLPAGVGAANPPRVYGVHSGTVVTDTNGVQLQTPTWTDPKIWPILGDQKFLYFDFATGRLARVNGDVTLGQHVLHPKPAPAPAPRPLAHSPLYSILFPERPWWPSIATARNYPQ